MMSTQIEYEDSEDIKTKIVEGENTKGCFSSFLCGMGKSIYKGWGEDTADSWEVAGPFSERITNIYL